MKNTSYSPIDNNITIKTFFNYIQYLKVPFIDYFAVGVQNQTSKTSRSLMSRAEWQQHFIKNQYADNDPLRKVVLNTKRTLILFQEIDCVNNLGTEIMQQRKLMDIKDGIILIQRNMGCNYMITLGTGYSQFDAYDFIRSYHDKINLIKNDLITLIESDAKKFLSNFK